MHKYIKNSLNILVNIVMISIIWLTANWIHLNWIGFLPAVVIALFIILFIVSIYNNAIILFDKGAYFLISHMILLFVPLIVLTAEQKKLFMREGVHLVLVMCLSTICIMLTVGFVVKILMNHLNKRKTFMDKK